MDGLPGHDYHPSPVQVALEAGTFGAARPSFRDEDYHEKVIARAA
jgi:hypothetical protein